MSEPQGNRPRRRWRYLAPNAVTATSILFGAIALASALAGKPRTAAWWVMYCTLTDKLDGLVARRLDASSAFGAQMDSFADFLSFGIAPAVAITAFFLGNPQLGWATGPMRGVLLAIAFVYILCAATRLARFNVTVGATGTEHMFFGMPSTFSGGLVCALLATGIKYGDPSLAALDPSWDRLHLLGGLRLDGALRGLPVVLLGFGLLMVSTLRVPKLRKSKRAILNVWLVLQVGFAYTAGWARVLPEYLAIGGVSYLAGSLWWHFTSPMAKQGKLPRLFE